MRWFYCWQCERKIGRRECVFDPAPIHDACGEYVEALRQPTAEDFRRADEIAVALGWKE